MQLFPDIELKNDIWQRYRSTLFAFVSIQVQTFFQQFQGSDLEAVAQMGLILNNLRYTNSQNLQNDTLEPQQIILRLYKLKSNAVSVNLPKYSLVKELDESRCYVTVELSNILICYLQTV